MQWTETAKNALRKLPPKVRRGILNKADELLDGDPRERAKPLKGPGYYRIVYSRYRAVFSVEEERIASGDVLLHIKVLFVIAGIRKEHDKKDVYKVAEKIVKLILNDGETLEELRDAGGDEEV
jgi:mRNA-degrading endonuclease RelE of RelBE toxin-antitoxin system